MAITLMGCVDDLIHWFFVFLYIYLYVGQILITVFCWSILSSLAQKRRYKSYVCSVLRRHLWITFCSCLNFLDMLLTTFCILNMYYLYYFRCMTYVKVFSLTLFSRYMNYVVILRLQYFNLSTFEVLAVLQALLIDQCSKNQNIILLIIDAENYWKCQL